MTGVHVWWLPDMTAMAGMSHRQGHIGDFLALFTFLLDHGAC